MAAAGAAEVHPTAIVHPSATIGRANLDGTGITETLVAGLTDLGGVAADVTPQASPPSRVSIGDVRMAEGDTRQTAFRFTVSLDQAQPRP